jgi:SAM-dependent methyltransferase
MKNHKEMMKKFVSKYEEFYNEYGDSSAGVGWFKAEMTNPRFEALTSHIPKESFTILDFGCGLGAMYDWMDLKSFKDFQYIGIDITPNHIEVSKRKFPNSEFYLGDVLTDDTILDEIGLVDYSVLCGVFTMKINFSDDDMFEFMKNILKKIWSSTRISMSFNLTSDLVDYKKDDLMHVPFDKITKFVNDELSRNFEIKAHYGGSYEYSVIVNRIEVD